MNIKNLKFLIGAIVIITFASCNENEWFDSDESVYIGGIIDDGIYSGATCWKNGREQIISLKNHISGINSIFIDQKDVYAVGHEKEFDLNNSKAMLWKNSESCLLSNGAYDASATSVCLWEGNVYVVGYNGRNGRLWINGEGQDLSHEGFATFLNDIFVDENGEIYIAGECIITSETIVAFYWTHGKFYDLTELGVYGSAKSITVSNGVIYVSGQKWNSDTESYVAKYWMNGEGFDLTDGKNSACANSIFVNDGNIYIAGSECNSNGIDVAKYWKNGKGIELTTGAHHASANDIFVVEGKAFITGEEYIDDGYPVMKYWKNGEDISISKNKNSRGNSIFVVRN